MGANAQTTVQNFVDGAVLTAAQQNFSAATGVPVFATTVTRDAAFGGANKVLAEGQTCYLESTNVVQFYDGAAWATVGPAAAGALVRVGGGALSGASTAFSSVFSATYDAYKIVVSNMNNSAAQHITFKLGASSTGYYFAIPAVSNTGVTQNYNGNNTASITFLQYGSGVSGLVMDVINPFLSVTSVFTWNYLENANSGFGTGSGRLADSTSYTAFTLNAGGGTFTGTVNIYGYALS